MIREMNLSLSDDDLMEKVSDALSSPVRRKIIRLLCDHSYSVYQIAQALNLSMSTTSFHLKMLREAKLIKNIANPSKKGNEKNVSVACERCTFDFVVIKKTHYQEETQQIPLGSFTDFNITPPCCICTSEYHLSPMDDVSIFKNPKRIQAQLISFFKGSITYSVALDLGTTDDLFSITFFMELCSECPDYNNSWKSDITFWVNGVEVATYLSLGDYGDRRGILTPSWWPDNSTQYGMPVTLKIAPDGAFLNGQKTSDVTIKDLHLKEKSHLFDFTIGVKDNAKYVGGVNIFGRNFGDISDDIKVQLSYYSESEKKAIKAEKIKNN